MADTLEKASAFSSVICPGVRDACTHFFKSCGELAPIGTAQTDEEAPSAGIMATISFVGDPAWAFALAFPQETAVTLAKAFAGFDIPFLSADMGDLLGELVNVIAGDVSARLAAQGVESQMSLPTVVRGDHISLLVPSIVATKLYVFAGPVGTCWLKLVSARADGLAFRRPG